MSQYSGKWTNSDKIETHLQHAEVEIPNIINEEIVLDGIGDNQLKHNNIAIDSEVIKIQRSITLDTDTPILNGTVPVFYPLIIKYPIRMDILGGQTGRTKVTHISGSPFYIEGKDFVIDYKTGGLSRASTGSSITSGQEVEISYILYEVLSKNADYSIDYNNGTIKRLTGTSIPDKAIVYTDYTHSIGSVTDNLIKQAIIEAENFMDDKILPDVTNETVITSATYYTLAIICNSMAIKELSLRDDNSSKLADKWKDMSEVYTLNANTTFQKYLSALPIITNNPDSQTAKVGATITFSVIATGENLTYQWQKGIDNIIGATSSSFETEVLELTDSGDAYRCIVTNSVGSAISTDAIATVTKLELPIITTNPNSQTAKVGATITFSVIATGESLTYQWQKGIDNIIGATSSSFETEVLELTDSGDAYRCIVTNSVGSAISTDAIATVTKLELPIITTNPNSQTAKIGATITFSVIATGENLTYQWQKGIDNIIGATSSSFETEVLELTDSGDTYRCVVTNSVGSAISTDAITTVTISGITYNDFKAGGAIQNRVSKSRSKVKQSPSITPGFRKH